MRLNQGLNPYRQNESMPISILTHYPLQDYIFGEEKEEK